MLPVACGFARGYFGIQVNSKTERRVIFSVWDSGNEGKDRKKVAKEDLVTLLAEGRRLSTPAASAMKGQAATATSKATCGKPAVRRSFLVTARADGDATVYTGYFYFNDKQQWGLIASFRAPHDGKLLRGLYSFNEDFDGGNGHLQRLCEFGNQWIKTTDGKWIELTTANFTHDPTGGKDRRDYGAGVTKDGRFFLSNGGFIAFPMERGPLSRPARGNPPVDVAIPLMGAKSE